MRIFGGFLIIWDDFCKDIYVLREIGFIEIEIRRLK